MKWAGFGAFAASTAPCVNVRGGSCDYGGKWTSSSLRLLSLHGRVVLSILLRSDRCVDPPKATKIVDALLL
jgi:hypothetical protein